jgi:nanoRNase/pAp phosphatase (c-di-AMP/oligoRNAs hydrolase)
VEQPEIVAEVADLLHRCERITWAFCMANMNGRLLVSMRSSDPGARCNRLLRHFIGKNGNAGGHHHMAAGFMNTAGQSPEERDANRDQLIQKLALQIERRYIRRTGANEAFEAQSLIEPGAKVQ